MILDLTWNKARNHSMRTGVNANIYLLTSNLLTPGSRVFLEKQTVCQLVKKFLTFYGTRRFITAFTSARHLSLSWASTIQSIPPHPTSWRSILILSSHLRLGLPSGLFPSGFPTKTLYRPLLSPIRATCSSHLILFDLITRTLLGEQYRSLSSSLCIFLHSPVTSSFLDPNILLSTIFSNTLNVSDQVSHAYKTTGKFILWQRIKINKSKIQAICFCSWSGPAEGNFHGRTDCPVRELHAVSRCAPWPDGYMNNTHTGDGRHGFQNIECSLRHIEKWAT